jgi:hypothetical protein
MEMLHAGSTRLAPRSKARMVGVRSMVGPRNVE